MNLPSDSWWEESIEEFLNRLLNGRLSVIPFERVNGKYWCPAACSIGRPVEKAIYQDFRRRAEAAGKRVHLRRKPLFSQTS
jgi:hypothetical protein